MKIKVTLDDWLYEVLVDPITKSKVNKSDNFFLSKEGFLYSITQNIPDFRIRLNKTENDWLEGQIAFENWKVKYLENAEKNAEFYPEEQKRDEPMYKRLTLDGRVLDVGGQLGNIRLYMAENQEFCSIDPFINVWKLAEGKANLFKHYPHHVPLNFIAGYAEFLPFEMHSFDTINMRSCIDHFFNPELALIEAFRVLKPNGKLIIGMTVEVQSLRNTIKEAIRTVLNIFTKKYDDHHIWHPSREEIIEMCKTCGFDLEDEIWQSDNIWYVSFRKTKSGVLRIT